MRFHCRCALAMGALAIGLAWAGGSIPAQALVTALPVIPTGIGDDDCNDNGVPDEDEASVTFTEHILANGDHGTRTADFDGDGDLDLLIAHLGWLENADGSGLVWVNHPVVDTFAHVLPSDVDGDGDPDIVAVIVDTDELVWFENTDGAGSFGPPALINDQISADSIFAADIDGDGDPDILRAASSLDIVDWYENLDGKGGFGPQQVLSLDPSPSVVSAADVDNDGDLDLLVGFRNGVHEIAWYENLDGSGSFGPRNLIANIDEPEELVPADIDGDGWIDLLTASTWDDFVAWYRNEGGGLFGTKQIIPLIVEEPTVTAGDLDGDGDLDVIGTHRYEGKVSWSRNLDGLGDFGPEEVLAVSVQYTSGVAVADLDGDGDRDVLFTGQSGTRWMQNLGKDCDANGIPDDCDVAAGTGEDCNSSDALDICELNTGAVPDCNATGVPDSCDIAGATSLDCNSNGVPDECEPDCNLNTVPDDCDIATGASDDCTGNTVPDECEQDCNDNDQADSCDIADGISNDVDGNGVPDECGSDCNGNGVADSVDIDTGTSLDCNGNGAPDSCDLQWGASEDCDSDGILDECEFKIAFDEHLISDQIDQPRGAAAGDIDADGDLDAISASIVDGKIRWYENIDGLGLFGPGQVVNSIDHPAKVVLVSDIDGDGDSDILTTGSNDVMWFENVDGGSSFVDHYIESNKVVTGIHPADLDGDEDIDIAFASYQFHEAGWYENVNGTGATWSSPKVLTEDIFDIFHATVAIAADMDDDGDNDIVAAGVFDIKWFEGADDGTFGESQLIKSYAGGVVLLEASDLDGDGDLDIMSVSSYNDRTVWYENIDGATGFGPERLVGISGGPRHATALDFDGDGDLDVAVASEAENTVSWFENLDGSGTFGPQRIISSTAMGAWAAIAADIDRDFLPDVLVASEDDDTLAWHENLSADCNANDALDSCDLLSGSSLDCDGNLTPDECQPDCDGDDVPDVCEIDCNGNYLPDECELADGAADCNGNSVPDDCDIAGSLSTDCGGNGVPDECEPDCNGNGIEDSCDIASGFSTDCSGQGNGIPDECEPDCNGNEQADGCDITVGVSADCNFTAVPDECELESDCDGNIVPDECDIAFGFIDVPVQVGAGNPRGVFAADLDGDGVLDVLSATSNDDSIAWYKLNPDLQSFGPPQVITSDADGARSVSAADLDGDGDMDVLSASFNNNMIAWYENTDGAGAFGPLQAINPSAVGASSVTTADLDGDGDVDVLSAAGIAIQWYENFSGAFLPHLITAGVAGAASVATADLDGDGDLDALSASSSDDTIAWYENTDGNGSFGPARLVSTGSESARSVSAADVDGDGDADILVAGGGSDSVVFYENIDGAGTFDLGTTIAANLGSARGAVAVDVEGDGDLDVLWTSLGALGYNENLDGQGSFGPIQLVAATNDSWSVMATDLNGDANADFLSASTGWNLISWYRNNHLDCNTNGIPDACEPDCDLDGIPDDCDLRLGMSRDCNGNAVPDGCDTGCIEACDTDGDGCYDDVDDEPENPNACNDADGDGCDDCSSGVFNPGQDGVDTDSDGWCDIGDCSSLDASVWSDPGAVDSLTLGGGEFTQLLWQPPSQPGAIGVAYDMLRSADPADFVAEAVCLETVEADTIAEDSEIPAAGEVFHYLIRVMNNCPGSIGAMGIDSNGTPRTGAICP